MKFFALCFGLFFFMFGLGVATLEVVKPILAQSKAENECIRKNVSYGVPRKNIILKDGNCYVKAGGNDD